MLQVVSFWRYRKILSGDFKYFFILLETLRHSMGLKGLMLTDVYYRCAIEKLSNQVHDNVIEVFI